MRNVTLLPILLALVAANASAAASPAQEAFEDLGRLVGTWESVGDPARRHTVDFRLIANGTALVETWMMSPTRSSMTVYALDGTRLLATHFCPQGNQPRLAWAGKNANGHHQFRFLDGTNLQDPTGSHQHALWIEVDSADSFRRSETYIENAKIGQPVDGDADEAVVYRRIAAATPPVSALPELEGGTR
jgi:hypothetical protein